MRRPSWPAVRSVLSRARGSRFRKRTPSLLGSGDHGRDRRQTYQSVPSTSKMMPRSCGAPCSLPASGFKGANRRLCRFAAIVAAARVWHGVAVTDARDAAGVLGRTAKYDLGGRRRRGISFSTATADSGRWSSENCVGVGFVEMIRLAAVIDGQRMMSLWLKRVFTMETSGLVSLSRWVDDE